MARRHLRRRRGGAISKSTHPAAIATLVARPSTGTSSSSTVAFSTRLDSKRGPRSAPSVDRARARGLALHGRWINQRDIARNLWVTEQTVKFHLSNAVLASWAWQNSTEASRYGPTCNGSGRREPGQCS